MSAGADSPFVQQLKRGWIWPLLFFALLMLADSPLIRPVPGRDAGVYGYVGQRMLAGDWPYRDVFDHKPPLIYLVNALGLWLGGGSLWGVWLLEMLWFGAAVWLAAALLRRQFGDGVAIAVTGLLLACISLIGSLNRPETLALLPQAAALWLVAGRRQTLRTAAWLGLLAAVALLLKHNLVGLWPAIGLLWLWQAWRDGGWGFFARRVAVATLAGTALAGSVGAIFWLGAGGVAVWDALVRFNLSYVQSVGWTDRALSIIGGLELLAPTGLALLALAGWLGAARAVSLRRAEQLPAVVLLALLALPIELLLAALPGQGYPHYFLPWLLSLALLAGYLLADLAANLPPLRQWAAVLLLAACLLPLARLGNRLLNLGGGDSAALSETATIAAAVRYVTSHSAADDPVLVWGGATTLNLLANRRAPVRMHYQYPLYVPGYQSEALVSEFVAQLAADPPLLIIVNWPPGSDDGDFIAGQARFWANFDAFDWYPLPGMRAAYLFVRDNYRFVEVVGPDQWAVYERIDQ